MDFSKLENIIFVAVSAALALFLLVAFFVSVSKGKHKTNGFDIFTRIVSILTLIVYAVLFVAAIFSEFTGDYRIALVTEDPISATLIFGTYTLELPLPQLFITLSTRIGREILLIMVVLSFIVTVANFMSGKRKYGAAKRSKDKKSDKKQKQSPEEIKRAAELEKIKRLGDAAVKKTNAVASSAAADNSSAKSESPAEKSAADEEPDWLKAATGEGDWRSSDGEKSEFVGVSRLSDSDADFDTFDEPAREPEKPWYEPDGSTDADTDTYIADEAVDEPDEPEDEPTAADGDEVIDEPEPEANIDEVYDETEPTDGVDETIDDDEEPEEYVEEPTETDEPTSDEVYDDTDESYTDEAIDDTDDVDYASSAAGKAEAEYENGEHYEEDGYADNYADADDGEIEPNRDIYIPRVRTIERRKKSAKDPKPDPKREAVEAVEEKEEAVKPVAKKSGGAKKNKPSGGKSAKSGKSANKGKGGKKDPKTLPVTRRYVILDRQSAVNIFSEYLKERDKADKDKLEASISTIIIE